MQAATGRPPRRQADAHQFEFTLQDANLASSMNGRQNSGEDADLAGMRDVATDQADNGTTLELRVNRDPRLAHGIQPQLIDDTLYEPPVSAGDAIFHAAQQYHVILEGAAECRASPIRRQDLYEIADYR